METCGETMKSFIAALLCVPVLCLANPPVKPVKPDNKTKPIEGDRQLQKDNSGRDLAIAIVGFGGLVYLAYYLDDQKKKRIALEPTQDGKGAMAKYEARF